MTNPINNNNNAAVPVVIAPASPKATINGLDAKKLANESSCPTVKKVLTIALLVVGIALIISGVGAGLGAVFALAGGSKALAAVGFAIAASTGLKVAVIAKIALGILAAGIAAVVVAVKKLRTTREVAEVYNGKEIYAQKEVYDIDPLVVKRKEKEGEKLERMEQRNLVTDGISNNRAELERVIDKDHRVRMRDLIRKERKDGYRKDLEAKTNPGAGLDAEGEDMRAFFGA